MLIPKDSFVTSLLRNNTFDEGESDEQKRDPFFENEFDIR